MIKTLHYVWFGRNPIPASVNSCINSWKKFCPDWEIVQWDENNFPVNNYVWVKEAIESKSYAHAADFVRLWVLVNKGGAYLDTDVELLKPLDGIINDQVVLGIENHRYGSDDLNSVSEDGFCDIQRTKRCSFFCVQAGFMYSEPNHDYFKDFMKVFYDDGQRHFINLDGTSAKFTIDPKLMMHLLKWGGKYRDITQHLANGITLYKSDVFATRNTKNKDSYLVHWFDQSWETNGGLVMKIKKFIKRYFYFFYRMQ